MAHAEHHEDVSDQADGGDGAGLGGFHADGVGQVSRQVGQHGVEADRVEHTGSEADDQRLEVVAEQLDERREHAVLGRALGIGDGGSTLGFERVVHRLVYGRIGKLGTDVQHDQAERSGKQERHAPSPTDHCAGVHVGGHQGGQRGAGEQADGGGGRNQRAVDAAL